MPHTDTVRTFALVAAILLGCLAQADAAPQRDRHHSAGNALAEDITGDRHVI